MRMGQGVRTGLGHRGITCVFQTHLSSFLFVKEANCEGTAFFSPFAKPSVWLPLQRGIRKLFSFILCIGCSFSDGFHSSRKEFARTSANSSI